jgi:hypothetical protein
VAAIAPDDVWAVGETYDQGPPPVYGQFMAHWNGRLWRHPAPPPVDAAQVRLFAITAVPGTKELWAVGYVQPTSSRLDTLIEHYDGGLWTVVSSPNPGSGDVLYGVSATSATDAWAVGRKLGDGFGASTTLIEHWDGTAWTTVRSPNAGAGANELSSVSAVTPTTAWAVGRFGATTLAERWNGRHWRIVPSPDPGVNDSELLSVHTVGPRNAWAVGFRRSHARERNLVEHWNGVEWSVARVPNPGAPDRLNAIGGSSAGDLWAVGTFAGPTFDETLALQGCG